MSIFGHTIWRKRLPSIFGFFFLLMAIVTIGFLSRNAILFGTKAAAGNTPKEVKISNVSDTTFTVSYATDANVLGTIKFGSLGKMDQVALDDRDKPQAKPTEHTTHHITVENLAPSTTYSFTITSGDENFLDGEAAYQVTTGAALEASSTTETIMTGKVTNDDGSPATGALVYVSGSNSQVLSTYTNGSGSYTININTMRTNNLASFINLVSDTVLQLQIVDATKESKVSLLTSQTNPIPMVILSKNYDFAVSNDPLAPSPVASDSADLSGTPSVSPVSFPTTAGDEEAVTAPKILTPQEEQEFKDQQPLFKGQAEPNETVTITINSEQTITAKVQTDANGNWQYRPDEPLEPGNHTITIRTIDASGLVRTITKSFVVYAEGSQFVEPSVSPSANATNTPTATPKPQATNTPTPTKKVTATTTNPTATNTPTPTTKVATSITASPTTPPIPVTGNPSLLLTIVGIISAVGIGALLFIFATV